MLLEASSHTPRDVCADMDWPGAAKVKSRDPTVKPPREPWEKGPTGQAGFLLEKGGRPWEPSLFPGEVLESRVPYEVCRWLQGTAQCQHGHVSPGKWKFPQKGNFSWERSSVRQAGSRWVAQPEQSHQQHHVCQWPDPATTQDQGI